MTTKCGCCGKDYDFDIQPSSYCTFHKKEYCWQCAKGCKDDTASCHYLSYKLRRLLLIQVGCVNYRKPAMAKLNSCIDHDFVIWAFGDAWLDYLSYDLDTIDLMKVWNERHGDKLMLEPDGNLVGDMGKMKQIWKEYANSSKD